MYRNLACVCLASFFFLGCADDPQGIPDAGPLPVDQCQNSADLAIVNAAIDAPDGGFPDAGRTDGVVSGDALLAVTNAVADCTQTDCTALILSESPELPMCMQTCLVGTPGEGLSTPCVACWVELTNCAVDNCLLVCAEDPYSPGCEQCTTTYCHARIDACTGYDFPMP